MKIVNHHAYALRLPPREAKALAAAQAKSGQSRNTLIVHCVRQALPDVVARFQPPAARVTNVDPLPKAVFKRIYSKPEEEDEEGVRLFVAAQRLGGDA
jgi:hypothetical protein